MEQEKQNKRRHYRKPIKKHAIIIQFGRILGELDYYHKSELDDWLEETGFRYFLDKDLAGLEIQYPKRKQQQSRKRINRKKDPA